MDYALTNYNVRTTQRTEADKTFNVNDFILEEFKKELDAKPKTKETYIKGVKVFLEWCSDNNIQEVTRATIISYKEDLVKNNKKASTISMYVTAIKKLYNFLESKGIRNVTRDIKGGKHKKNHSKDSLTLEQAKALLNSIDRTTITGKRDYAMIYLFLTTALRTIEVERANIEDIRNKGNLSVLYIMGKGEETKEEYVILTPETLQAINDYLVARGTAKGTDPLFISYSDRTKGKGLKTRSIRDIIKKSLINIGINSDRITTHSLRHSAITFSLMAGTPLQEVQQMARHKSITTTMIYAHNLDRMKSQAEQNIQNLLNS